MYRSNDSAARSDMTTAASATVSVEPRPARGYASARAAATRPVLPFAALVAGRQRRALQLSWVGLVRR